MPQTLLQYKLPRDTEHRFLLQPIPPGDNFSTEDFIDSIIKKILPTVKTKEMRAQTKEALRDTYNTDFIKKVKDGDPEATMMFELVRPILAASGKKISPDIIYNVFSNPANMNAYLRRSKELPEDLKLIKNLPAKYINKNSDEYKKAVAVTDFSSNNFGGDIAAEKAGNVDIEVDRLKDIAEKYSNEGNEEKEREVREVIDSIFKASQGGGKNSKTDLPIFYAVSGIEDPSGNKLQGDSKGVYQGNVLSIPSNEDFLNKDKFSDEDLEYIKKHYLKSDRLPKYISSISSNREMKEDSETFSLLLKLAEKYKDIGDVDDRIISLKPFEKIDTGLSYLPSIDDEIRNRTGYENIRTVTQKYFDEDDPDQVLKRFITDIDDFKKEVEGSDDASDLVPILGNAAKLGIKIPWDSWDFYTTRTGGGDKSHIFEKYNKAYKNCADKNECKLPITGRKQSQDAVNKTLTTDDIEKSKYFDQRILRALKDKNIPVIRKFFVSDERGNLSMRNTMREHVTPISEIFEISWDLFKEMKKAEYDDNVISETMYNLVRATYKEAILSVDFNKKYLDASGLRDISGGGFRQNLKSDLKSGKKITSSELFDRYKLAGIQGNNIPTPLSVSKSEFPDRVEGVTYQDIARRKDYYKPNQFEEGLSKSITKLLFTYY